LIFSLLAGPIPWPPLPAWIPLIYVALFEMSLTFILWLTALQNTNSTATIGNLMYLTPFLSLLCLHIFIGEQIQQATFVGLSIIIGSILFQSYGVQRTK